MRIVDIQRYIEDRFSNVEFEESSHTYWVNSRKVKNVSSAIADYKPKFKRKHLLDYCSKQRGVDRQELDDEWTQTCKIACDKGHRWHLYMEETLEDRARTVEQIAVMKQYLDKEFENIETVGCEIRMGLYYLTGTLDYLGFNHLTGKLVMRDWKTNRQFSMGSSNIFQGRLRGIPASQYAIYSIQQNLYQHLLAPQNIGLEMDMELVHFTDKEYKSYTVPVMERAVNVIVEDRKEQYKIAA